MNKFMKKIMSKKDGFTLVELIVVIAILAILAGVAVPAYSAYINNANEAADKAALDALTTAAQAALVEEGAVTAITVTQNGTTKAVTKITAQAGGTTYCLFGTADGEDATQSGSFLEYYTGSSSGTFSLTLKVAYSAISWSSSGWALTRSAS